MVLDPLFVKSNSYAQQLVAEIPPNKRLETLIEIYRKKVVQHGDNIQYVLRAMQSHLDDDQIKSFVAVVSDELRTVQSDGEIILALRVLPPELWAQIAYVPRQRIENRVIESIKEGEILNTGKVTGALGTWSGEFLPHFSRKEDAGKVLTNKLLDIDADDRHYVARFFLRVLPACISDRRMAERCMRAITNAVRQDDEHVREWLLRCIEDYPEDWRKWITTDLEDVTDVDSPAIYLPDGTPFLRSQLEIEEKDIPF